MAGPAGRGARENAEIVRIKCAWEHATWANGDGQRFHPYDFGVFPRAPAPPAASLTVAENVALGIKSHLMSRADLPGRVAAALESVGMEHLATAFPGTLSGGEQQRVAIARALARRTPLLLADEPTGNLDQGNADAVVSLLRQEVLAGAALLLVTHDPDLAAQADRTIVLTPPRLTS